MTTSSSGPLLPPDSCDYLVVGAGATGMAFVDSLIQGTRLLNNKNKQAGVEKRTTSIVLLDQHSTPGGQWHDSYSFVRLHQPSAGYGVESTPLESSPSSLGDDDDDGPAAEADQQHLATRVEILEYYQQLSQKWEQKTDDFDFCFIGNATLDFKSKKRSVDKDNMISCQFATTSDDGGGGTILHSMSVRKRLVDARYLAPDLPVTVAPKFSFNANHIRCVPVNEIMLDGEDESSMKERFVIIGAGKTGMDAVYYLLTQRKIVPNHIAWVAPHIPWITARENIGNCMEFLRDVTRTAQKGFSSSGDSQSLSALLQSSETVQKTFQQWEREGRIYRLFHDDDDEHELLPTKFQDATLSQQELQVLRQIPSSNLIRGEGRVQEIHDNGDLIMHDGGKTIQLPWGNNNNNSDVVTTYVHCSAGAFNYTQHIGHTPPPVFDDHTLTIQDVYGTPGFCFVGSIMGKLESLPLMTDQQKNALCRAPRPPVSASSSPLGPSGGDVVGLSMNHGYVQRLLNLRDWLQRPELRDWLVGHRLFNLGHFTSAEEIEKVVEEAYSILQEGGLL